MARGGSIDAGGLSVAELRRRLAEACGIGLAYDDIHGRRHEISDATVEALLPALGVRATTVEDVQRELAERSTRSWRRTLPPVLVARHPFAALEVPLVVAERQLGEPRVAEIVHEDGSGTALSFVPAELPADDAREIDGQKLVRCRLSLGSGPALGYHDLRVGSCSMRLIVAPERCYIPQALAEGARVWGPVAQLYALRSAHNWGVGDYGDLLRLVELCGELGAGVVGTSPLHALFSHNPSHASPYSPSSRAFFNTLFLDVAAVAAGEEAEAVDRTVGAPEFQARLLTLRQSELVDYPAVAAAKRDVLHGLWERFRGAHLAAEDDLGRRFRAFQRERGTLLEAWGAFEALGEHCAREQPDCWGWPVWPERYRRHDGEAVAQFAAEHRIEVEYHQWLQWHCDLQLGAAGRRCQELGQSVGLYADLAVGVDRAGFEAWRFQDLYALEAGIGAPPDDFNLKGQDWGLPPWVPDRLRECGYAPLVESLRANMRHAGALRIDHVMGLMRAYWIPPGRPPTEGAYVHYPFADLLGIVALESQRQRCMVVGEDLGTVPDEVRRALGPAGILSYRLFFFMKQPDGEFTRPAGYPEPALVAVTTHDLPTLAGYWQGRDIAVRAELGLFPDERAQEQQLLERTQDRTRLLFALGHEGLLPEGVAVDLARFPDMTADLAVAIHRYLARSRSKVLALQLEDVLGQREQANLPGTTDAHPNWRRKLAVDLESLAEDPRLRRLAQALSQERGAGRVQHSVPREPAAIRATYRVQLGADFTFESARKLVPYLARLGASHLYTSPFLRARPGSRHGYDVVDHGTTNPEIGSPEDLERLIDTLHEHDMGLVIDLVPNHMAVGSDNPWWMSVLEHGRASPWAEFFDVQWRPRKEELRGRVLLPVLEDHFGKVLEQGLLRLRALADTGELEIAYRDQRFPLDPVSYAAVLGLDLERLGLRLGRDSTLALELDSLVASFGNLPGRAVTDPEQVDRRLRDTVVLKRRLAALIAEDAQVASLVAENVALHNAPGNGPASDLLERLLDAQAYRLSFWRVASDEINYRRFFDINDLAGIRQEIPRVFEATHRFVLDLVRRGRVDGLRIDHADGLHDPSGYFQRLRQATADAPGAAPWIVIEKILGPAERLREDWPVDGTTGYDFANLVCGLHVDPAAERALSRHYARWLDRRADPDGIVFASKRLILDTALAGDLTVLSADLERIFEADRYTRDFTLGRLHEALATILSSFPVYRTYVGPDGASDEDRRQIDVAVARAKAASQARETSIYDHIRRVLLLEAAADKPLEQRRALAAFVGKFQQTTSPVAAKGLEDTTFYVFNRLLALNEVGGDPRRFGATLDEFHSANAERRKRWPRAMLASSTHDTKRSEDARARLAVLSEIPEQWQRASRRWATLNRRHKKRVHGRPAPSRNDEYGLYQALLAIWPLEDGADLGGIRARLHEYVLKAAREAKVHSSWIEPDTNYERACTGFVDSLLDPDGRFPAEFQSFARRVARLGLLVSLSQVLLKLTAPGIPDIYQGNETWEFRLVDPDNRRPVDFARRARLLDEIDRAARAPGGLAAVAADVLGSLPDGRAKLWVTWRTLQVRREHERVFREGTYERLCVEGPHAEHVCAFARRCDAASVLVVAPRLVAAVHRWDGERLHLDPALWAGTSIGLDAAPGGAPLCDAYTGARFDAASARLELGELLGRFPVALLHSAA